MVRKLKTSNSNPSSQGDIIKKAQVMQQQMLEIQEELKNKFVEETVAGGLIKIKANGQKEVVELKISKEVIEDALENAEELESLILTAISNVSKKAEELAEKEMSVVTGGMSIPGLF